MTAHPAAYTDALLPVFACLLPRGARLILDLFAGTGKVSRLRAWRPDLVTFGAELESEWCSAANAAGCFTPRCSAVALPYPDQAFDVIVTSPAYGNRMADHHNARERCRLCGGRGRVCRAHGAVLDAVHLAAHPECDNVHAVVVCVRCDGQGVNDGPRHTYTHVLGHDLHPQNSGAMQWGDAYRALHLAAWAEARRVLRPGGALILNCKDHIRAGVLQPVTNWHAVALLGLGFACVERVRVVCPGQRHGANGGARVGWESVLKFRLDR